MDITQRKLFSQLSEAPQKSLCDSGGAYGYTGEFNAKQGWENLVKDPCAVEAWVYKHSENPKLELNVTVSLAAYLENSLTYCEELDIELQEFYESHPNSSNLGIIPEFLDFKGIKYQIYNSYNSDTPLSGVIQYAEFEWGEHSEPHVLLSCHTGCDVRGSYSKPIAYSVRDGAYFGFCSVDGYGTSSQYWDEDGRNDRGENLFKDYPVYEFEYNSTLLKDLANLAQTDKNTPEMQAMMREQDALHRQFDFQEFCDSLEHVSIVVKDRVAYYVSVGDPEPISAESYSLMG